MPDPRSVGLVAARELATAWRNRWFLLFASAFGLLALGLSWLSVTTAGSVGFSGLGRTAASLTNLALLVVPLAGLALGAGALAPERERGALLLLAAQPIDLGELVVGKFLGLTAAVVAALAAGFGAAGLVIAAGGGEAAGAGSFLAFLGLTALLASAAVSLGLALSAAARRGSLASGLAIGVWLGLVFFGDLGVMGTAIALGLTPGELLTAALLNPLEVFKIAAILATRGGLEVLGPAGLYAVRTWGDSLPWALAVLLALWSAAPLAAAVALLRRRGVVP